MQPRCGMSNECAAALDVLGVGIGSGKQGVGCYPLGNGLIKLLGCLPLAAIVFRIRLPEGFELWWVAIRFFFLGGFFTFGGIILVRG